jgi:hypothetical protein
MSATQTYILRCDSCGDHFVPDDPLPKVLFEVRRRAAREAWEHRIISVSRGIAPSLDFCPGCVRVGAPSVHEKTIRDNAAAGVRP